MTNLFVNSEVVGLFTRLKKFSPRPRGKSVIGKILFEFMVKVAKNLLKKFLLNKLKMFVIKLDKRQNLHINP